MQAAENRAKNAKGKANARLRVLNVYLQPAQDGPRRFKDPAAPTGEPKPEPDTINLGNDFFK